MKEHGHRPERAPSHRRGLFAQAEQPGVSQAEGGDGGGGPQGGLVVAVPANAVLAVAVQVTQQGVEAAAVAARLLHLLPQAQQQRAPLGEGVSREREEEEGIGTAHRSRDACVRSTCVLAAIVEFA